MIPTGLVAAALLGLLVVIVARARKECAVRRRYDRRREVGGPRFDLYEATPSLDGLVQGMMGDRDEEGIDGPASVVLRHSNIVPRGIATRGMQRAVAECGAALRKHLFWVDTVAVRGFLPSTRRENGVVVTVAGAVRSASRRARDLLSPDPMDYLMVICEGAGAALCNGSGLSCADEDQDDDDGGTTERGPRDGPGRRRGGSGGPCLRFVAMRMSSLPPFMCQQRPTADDAPVPGLPAPAFADCGDEPRVAGRANGRPRRRVERGQDGRARGRMKE